MHNLAFLADEATTGPGGSDMNGDGDKVDSIAVVVDLSTNAETSLGVAAQTLRWIRNELYLEVDEAQDGRNWEPVDTGNKVVLLHWSAAAPTLTFVDVLSQASVPRSVTFGRTLLYSSATPPSGALASNLRSISSSSPLSPVPVTTTDVTGPLSPRILGQDEGLVFLALDESVEGRDLNGDGDLADLSVLALLDGTLAGNVVRSTGLALPGSDAPFRARRTSPTSHDWQVGFLVSEAGQGNTNLNDPALFAGTWKPSQCVGHEDADTTDSVLHFLNFAAWSSNPVTNPPVNTGLVGCRKIAIANNYIATITPEHDAADPNGAEGTCDLNGDGDTNDYVVRWVQMTSPILPLTPAMNIHALTNVAGGTHGLTELGTRFVIEVSEAQDNLDINGDALKTLDLIGWLLPAGSGNTSTPWDFTHGFANSTYIGASWMTETPDRSRLGLALEESCAGPGGTPLNINTHSPPIPGEDTDTLDSVPTFPLITGSPPYLNYPGVAIAVQTGNSGIVIARNNGFYRVSEAEDSRDWNSDGLETGFVLFGTSLSQGISTAIGTLNSIPGRPAIEFNSEESAPYGAAFLADEQYQGAGGTDLNGDGDAQDLVVGWFFLFNDCNNNGIPDEDDISSGTDPDCDGDGIPDSCDIAGGTPDCNGNGIPDSCDLASGTSLDINGNGIPDECEPTAGTPYCFGDLSGAACPCGNTGAAGHGCRNSTGQSAQLSALGTTNPDTVQLDVAGELPTALTIFLQGNATHSQVAFGDGLRCAGGLLKRLYIKSASGGQASAPGPADLSVTSRSAALGDPIQPGQARYYATYYRDGNPSFCPSPQGGTFNASNGVTIVW